MASCDLRVGDWRDVLADVAEVDAVITDPPYGARVHAGHDSAADQVRSCTGQQTLRKLGYEAWTPADVDEFVALWAPRCRGWIVALTSHDLIPAWEDAYRRAGRYAFAPVVCVPRKTPRLIGDGPSSWAVYAMVSRPRNREFAAWGTLPGGYLDGPPLRDGRVGGKPLWLVSALVRDYSRRGDLVCDPCAGYGTTLVAASLEGRRSVGAEIDEDCAALARERIARDSRQVGFDFDAAGRAEAGELFGGQK